jgi:hypothetical protein
MDAKASEFARGLRQPATTSEPTDLRDFDYEPDRLLSLGYERRDEESADYVRFVWYEKEFSSSESQICLVLQIEYELGLSDDLRASYSANCSYSFNGVYVRVLDRQMEEVDNYTFDEETANPRELGRQRLSVTTLEECDALAKLLRPGLRPGLW